MKKYIIIYILFTITLISRAQEQQASLTESTMGLQIGTFGVWIYNEAKISNSLALRADLGIDGYLATVNSDIFKPYVIPSVSMEPRWYYNLKRRVRKGRRIDSNSGDFVSLIAKINPNVFVFPNNINSPHLFSIIPTWGLRRAIGRNFNLETSMGAGYRVAFSPSTKTTKELIYYINLRFGFVF
ncbi:MAG: hypothetical protein C0595_09585 [Marinilabiliales bacterium]|nr:MAG: hypothetical protein C0595_09585 [Marinilabiliales bacterium]